MTTFHSPITAYRRELRERFGARHYRITRDGSIHAYGPMPSAKHITGWWFFGRLGDRQVEADLFGFYLGGCAK